jgi:hypothetical protein
MEDFKLILNQSLGAFVIGDDIRKYLHFSHTKEHREEKTFSYDSYGFYNDSVIIWTTEDNEIETIRCDTNCYWRGQNLIGMLYKDFLILSGQYPNTESTEYIPINPNRGQNQKVYTFDDLGLMIWAWRDKIRTVLISRYDQE